MNATTTETLVAEAARNLEGYISCGLRGLLQKGVDRCKALGMRDLEWVQEREDVLFLLKHLRLHWGL